MTAVTATPFTTTDAPRVELARLCRQICLSREKSPQASVHSLDHDLAQALAAVREAFGPDSVRDDDLLDLFRSEQHRVADAAALSELLAPKLADWLRAHGFNTPAATTPPHTEEPPQPSSRAPLSASPSLPAAPAGPPGIADLLDGMLEQDRHDERTRRSGSRR